MKLDTIVCMDALEYMRGLGDASVDMVLTDIPYGEVNKASSGLRNLNKSDADIVTCEINLLCQEVARVSCGWVYMFCGTEQVSDIRRNFQAHGMTRLMIWRKTNPTPLNGEYMWLSDIECFVALRKSKSTFHQFCHSSVITMKAGTSELHPTQKPVALFEYLIMSSTQPGDIVLDPFIGSGTTAVAARKTGRHYIGCDLSPEYVAIANKRLQDTDPYQSTQVDEHTQQLSLFGD